MVRKLLFVACAQLLALNIFSQEGIRFSVFANPCINWFSSDVKKVKPNGAVLGFDAGLTVDKYFAENYAFSSGISIGTLGGKLGYAENTGFNTSEGAVNIATGSEVKYNLQYITIPAGLKFKTREIGYFTYFAHLGLTSQFNIKASATSKPGGLLDQSNIWDDISLFNMGYHFGGGLHYSIGGQTAIVMGLTYTQGFIDVTSHSDKITSASLALRLGVLF